MQKDPVNNVPLRQSVYNVRQIRQEKEAQDNLYIHSPKGRKKKKKKSNNSGLRNDS